MAPPAAWPAVVKVPVFVAILMAAVATAVGYVVLTRLVADQEQHLRQLAATYADGIARAVVPHVLRRDIWETFDVLDRASGTPTGITARHVIVVLPDGTILAASDPMTHGVGARLLPALATRTGVSGRLDIDEEAGLAWYSQDLWQSGAVVGRLILEIDIADLMLVRRETFTTLMLVNAGLTLLFATAGYLWVHRMLRPLAILGAHVERMREGLVEPIPRHLIRGEGSEFGRLFDRFNAMAEALAERERLAARLAEEEKTALLGRLASGMAHEVNNPLGGLMNVVDTLKTHGHDPATRAMSLALLERGLAGIRDVVRAALVTYKRDTLARDLDCSDLDDIQHLLRHELHRRRLRLVWSNGVTDRLPVDGSAVRQVALNLLLNACAAAPVAGTVAFTALREGDRLRLTVSDGGPGLPDDMQALLRAKGVAPLPEGGRGLGLWTVARLLGRLGGEVVLDVRPGAGTHIAVIVPLGHRTQEAGLDAVA